MLVAQIGKPCGDVELGSALSGSQGGEPFIRRIIVVVEQTADYDIVGREVDLRLAQIALSPKMIGVGAGGQPRNNEIAIFRLDAVEKPCMVLDQRPGKGEARRELIEVQPVELAKAFMSMVVLRMRLWVRQS